MAGLKPGETGHLVRRALLASAGLRDGHDVVRAVAERRGVDRSPVAWIRLAVRKRANGARVQVRDPVGLVEPVAEMQARMVRADGRSRVLEGRPRAIGDARRVGV